MVERYPRYLVVAGPDGSGKTAVVERLVEEVLDGPVQLLHHRPGVLPSKTKHEGPVTEPHRQDPYPVLPSLFKLLYVFGDYWAGWFVQIRPHLRNGGTVIMERGWWDMAVDRRRYRLSVPRMVIEGLGRALPRPGMTVVLAGEPSLLRSRKPELPIAELQRQIAAWRRVPSRHVRPLYLDVSAPVADLAARIGTSLEKMSHQPGTTARHGAPTSTRGVERAVESAAVGVGLPRSSNPRWILPPSPPQVARAAVGVYHPVTTRGLVGWTAARALAGMGALRLLPARTPLPVSVLHAVAPHIDPQSRLAAARTNHRGGWILLVLSPDGRPSSVAKVNLTAEGRAELECEAQATVHCAPLLPAGVRLPRVLGQADGVVLFEPVAWRPRVRPWLLPVPVAHAFGRLYGETGLSHGDLAPWNLLRDDRGWQVIDWADAHEGGDPFDDVLHYLVQGHALLGHPRRSELLAGLAGHGWVGSALAAYADGAECDLGRARGALDSYLQRTLPACDPRQADGRRGREAREALIGLLR